MAVAILGQQQQHRILISQASEQHQVTCATPLLVKIIYASGRNSKYEATYQI